VGPIVMSLFGIGGGGGGGADAIAGLEAWVRFARCLFGLETSTGAGGRLDESLGSIILCCD